MCHVSVHSGALVFFDRFSDFNHLFELLDQILLPIAVVPFIGIKLKKHFKNVHCEYYEQFSCRKRMFPIQSHPRRSGILLFPDCPRFCRLMKTRNRRYPRSSRIEGGQIWRIESVSIFPTRRRFLRWVGDPVSHKWKLKDFAHYQSPKLQRSSPLSHINVASLMKI